MLLIKEKVASLWLDPVLTWTRSSGKGSRALLPAASRFGCTPGKLRPHDLLMMSFYHSACRDAKAVLVVLIGTT